MRWRTYLIIKCQHPKYFMAQGLLDLRHSQVYTVKTMLQRPLNLIHRTPSMGKTVMPPSSTTWLSMTTELCLSVLRAARVMDQLTEKIHQTRLKVTRPSTPQCHSRACATRSGTRIACQSFRSCSSWRMRPRSCHLQTRAVYGPEVRHLEGAAHKSGCHLPHVCGCRLSLGLSRCSTAPFEATKTPILCSKRVFIYRKCYVFIFLLVFKRFFQESTEKYTFLSIFVSEILTVDLGDGRILVFCVSFHFSQ